MLCSTQIFSQSLSFPQSTCSGCNGTSGGVDFSTVSLATTDDITLTVTITVPGAGELLNVNGILEFDDQGNFYEPKSQLYQVTADGTPQSFNITLDHRFYPKGIYTFRLAQLSYINVNTSQPHTPTQPTVSSKRKLYRAGMNFKPVQTQLTGNYPGRPLTEVVKYDGQIILGKCPDHKLLKGEIALPSSFTYLLTCELSEIADDYSQVGSKVSRLLTTAEITSLNNGTFDYFVFAQNTGGSPNITITDEKKYGINFILHNVSNSLNHWSHTAWYITYKDQNYDLIMRDFAYTPKIIGAGLSEPNDGDDQGQEKNRANGSIYEALVNNNFSNIYNSPDIWNRKSNALTPFSGVGGRSAPGGSLGFYHQNPDFVTVSTNANYLYLAVKNIGCATSPNEPEDVRAFWTRARLGETYPDHWEYDLTNNFASYNDPTLGVIPVPLGSEITIQNPTFWNPYNATSVPATVSSVPAYTDYETSWAYPKNTSTDGLKWYPPNPLWYNASNGSMASNGQPVICLLASMGGNSSNVDPLTYNPTGSVDIEDFVRHNNNVVTRNTTLVDLSTFITDHSTGVRNTDFHTAIANNPSAGPTRICFGNLYPHDWVDELNNYVTLEIGFTNGIWQNWVSNGMQGSGFSVVSPTLVEVTDYTKVCFDSITIGNEMDEQMGVRVLYDSATVMPDTAINYVYSLQQFSFGENTEEYIGSAVNYFIPIVSQNNENVPNNASGIYNIKKTDNFIEIYPNPTSNKISVLSSERAKTVTIRNMLGKVVLTQIVDNQKPHNLININVSILPKGAYLLSQQSENGKILTSKFIKN